jgi:hypothetical protein
MVAMMVAAMVLDVPTIPETYEEYDEFNFHHSDRRVNPDWILLDNCSTTDIFFNKKLVTNIGKAHNSLNIHCNAGMKVVIQVATMNNYGTVWYCKDAIKNILSLSHVKKWFRIRYDSANVNQFVVVKPDKEIIFNESKEGLYYHDTANQAMVMVNTVKEKKEGFTDREYHRAKEAHRALGLVGVSITKGL